jgi:hypothetical protein
MTTISLQCLHPITRFILSFSYRSFLTRFLPLGSPLLKLPLSLRFFFRNSLLLTRNRWSRLNRFPKWRNDRIDNVMDVFRDAPAGGNGDYVADAQGGARVVDEDCSGLIEALSSYS